MNKKERRLLQSNEIAWILPNAGSGKWMDKHTIWSHLKFREVTLHESLNDVENTLRRMERKGTVLVKYVVKGWYVRKFYCYFLPF